MTLGNQLVGIGLCVVFVSVAFEAASVRLSGTAVGAGLAIIGFLVLAYRAGTGDDVPDSGH